MAKPVTVERCAVNEPLYDVAPKSGDTVEIFYADGALAKSFGTRPGWFWWSCRSGSLPDRAPKGPFPTSYAAYRKTPGRPKAVVIARQAAKGKKPYAIAKALRIDRHAGEVRG